VSSITSSAALVLLRSRRKAANNPTGDASVMLSAVAASSNGQGSNTDAA